MKRSKFTEAPITASKHCTAQQACTALDLLPCCWTNLCFLSQEQDQRNVGDKGLQRSRRLLDQGLCAPSVQGPAIAPQARMKVDVVST
jgi:hypothetical protein